VISFPNLREVFGNCHADVSSGLCEQSFDENFWKGVIDWTISYGATNNLPQIVKGIDCQVRDQARKTKCRDRGDRGIVSRPAKVLRDAG